MAAASAVTATLVITERAASPAPLASLVGPNRSEIIANPVNAQETSTPTRSIRVIPLAENASSV